MSGSRFANASYRRLAWLAAMATMLLLVPKSSYAQIAGTILGTVKDSSGAVVPQAQVILVNTDTGETRRATSAPDGAFRFPALLAGHYSLRVEQGGFQTQTQTGLTLEVAQDLMVNPVLEVGSPRQELTITAQEPVVNTTNSTLGGVVNEEKMAELPLNGRNYSDLTYMQPGVTINSNMSSSNQQGGIRGTYFTSDGASIRSNVVTLDGAILTNLRGGSTSSESGTSLGVAGIKEYKVVTGVFDASYGNAPGAQVVMVSKGGSNQFHGELLEYLRNDLMDAANFFDKPVAANNFHRIPQFQRNNFGAAAGGPIKKDKMFFFAAYEGLRQRLGQTIIDTVPGAGCHGPKGDNAGLVTSTACPQLGAGAPSVTIAPVMNGLLGLYPIPNLPNNQYTFPSTSPSQVDWGQIRVDENISASDSLFGRYTTTKSYQVSATVASNAASGIAFPQFSTSYASYDQFATISENHIFSPTLLNQFRFSYSRTTMFEDNIYNITPYSPNGIASVTGSLYSMMPGLPVGTVSVSGLSGVGPGSNLPQGGKANSYVLNDDVYDTHGKHALRFGTQIGRYNIGREMNRYGQGNPSFSNLSNFLQGIAASYQALQSGGDTSRNSMYWVPGFYAQDDWRVLPRLTVNLGLRYEFTTVPRNTRGKNYALVNPLTDTAFTQGAIFAPFSKEHVSPRVGFAWDVFGNGKTSVRGGFGKYYDIGNMLAVLFNTKNAEPPLDGLLVSGQTGVITLPLTFNPATSIGVQTAAYYLENPSLLKWNLTVERQLVGSFALQVAYVGTRGLHLYQIIDGDPHPPTAVVNGLPYWNGREPLQNGHFGSVQMESTGGWSTYHGLQVALNKHLSHGLQIQTSYTFSKNLDDTQAVQTGDCAAAAGMMYQVYSGPGGGVFNKGPSCSDLTHVVRVNGLYHIPNIQSNNMAARMLRGWWVGIIWSAQTGYPFTPMLGSNRSQSQYLISNADRSNIATGTDAAYCSANPASCKYKPVPFDRSTVIEGDPAQWFNPSMFTMEPMVTTPGGSTVCTSSTCGPGTTFGTLGNVQRGLLRGPGLNNVDFSINKDTRLPFMGEQGRLEFRAEIFNILNHPNFAMPNGTVFSGVTTSYGPYSLAPNATAGVISGTVNTSRQVQLALKLVF